jgi:protein required for attachment to host cells
MNYEPMYRFLGDTCVCREMETAMTKSKMQAGDWIIVSDGRKALLLENEGDEKFPNLKTREVREHADAPNRDLNSDKPGRVQQSAASFHSSVEQTDRHAQEEEQFIIGLMDRLSELISSGTAKHLIIVAPPRVLGLIRKNCSAPVKSAIHAEFVHDLTHLPVHEIEQHLVKEMASG